MKLVAVPILSVLGHEFLGQSVQMTLHSPEKLSEGGPVRSITVCLPIFFADILCYWFIRFQSFRDHSRNSGQINSTF